MHLTLKDKGCLITTEIIGNNRYVRTIPPSCEIIKHIPTNDCSDCVILAREIPSHSGIFIAGMIARPKNGQIAVRILNTTDKEETIDFSFLEVHSLNSFEMCNFSDNNVSVKRVKTLFDLLDLSSYLNKEEQINIENICAKYADVFQLPGDKLSVTNLMEHTINFKENTTPIY